MQGRWLADYIRLVRSQNIGASKEGAPPGKREDSAGKDFESISKKPGSLMSLVGSALLDRLKLLC